MSIGRLGAALELSSGAVTGLVDRLVSAVHVERVADATDRRRVHLRVSDSAMAVAQDHFGSYAQRLREALDGFTGEELDAIARLLAAARDAAAPNS